MASLVVDTEQLFKAAVIKGIKPFASSSYAAEGSASKIALMPPSSQDLLALSQAICNGYRPSASTTDAVSGARLIMCSMRLRPAD